METGVGILSDVGSRLRSERERLRLNQEEFGGLAGVTRNSQQNYESGKRPFTVSYLLSLKEHHVDIVYVLVGQRSAKGLTDEQARIVSAYNALDASDQRALLHLACSLAGQPRHIAPLNLPSTAALADAFGGVLEASPGLAGDELAHELATRLPIILRSAEDEIASAQSGSRDELAELRADRDDDRRAAQPGRRT
jgi:transcriptional regulator with XRE-family HTH domain